MRATLFGATLAIFCGYATQASADTTYTFAFDPGETAYFRFSTAEWVGQSDPADSWDADVDAFENITAFAPSFPGHQHPTAQSISGATIKMRFVVTGFSGSFDSGLEIANFSITGVVRF